MAVAQTEMAAMVAPAVIVQQQLLAVQVLVLAVVCQGASHEAPWSA